jgi:hypothetical protein
MKSILDPTFRYVPSVQTDLRKTFARIRREQHVGGRGGGTATENSPRNVLSILQRRQAAPARIR